MHLKHIDQAPPGDQTRVWNPKIYPQDRGHRMPIITPAYPSMCSTHNVSASTAIIMARELKRGLAITTDVMAGKKPWSELLEPHDFFTKYRYYLQITASATSQNVLNRWSGTVEARIRVFVGKIEDVEKVEFAHPAVESFDRITYYLTPEERRQAETGDVNANLEGRTSADIEGKAGAGTVYTTTFYIGLHVQAKEGALSPDWRYQGPLSDVDEHRCSDPFR